MWNRLGAEAALFINELLRQRVIAPAQVIAFLRENQSPSPEDIAGALDFRGTTEVLADARERIRRSGASAEALLAAEGGLHSSLFLGSAVSQLAGRTLTPELSRPEAERYHDFVVVGTGGMGVVCAAWDSKLHRTVAFKMLRSERGEESATDFVHAALKADSGDQRGDAAARARFVAEAWITGCLEHPGIPPLHELGATSAGVPYYTMRFMRGHRSMREEFRTLDRKGESRLTAMLDPFLRLCDTVRYAHAQWVIHRDLKPENVMIGKYGEVVLIDWGLAKVECGPELERNSPLERVQRARGTLGLETSLTALGTLGYMAPEASMGHLDLVDARSDLFSLGAILHEILTARVPIAATDLPSYVEEVAALVPAELIRESPEVPEELAALCRSCLNPDRELRLSSVEVLAQGIRDWRKADQLKGEVRVLEGRIEGLLDEASAMRGAARLHLLVRVGALLDRMEPLDESEKPRDLRKRLGELEALGFREQTREETRRQLRRVALGAAVVLVGVGLWVLALLNEGRVEAEDARGEAESALAEVLRLGDIKRARDLVAAADEIWPVHPQNGKRWEAWLSEADDLVAKRSIHEDSLHELDLLALPYTEEQRNHDHAAALKDLDRAKRTLAAAESEHIPEALQRKYGGPPGVKAMRDDVARLEAAVAVRGRWDLPSQTQAWRHAALRELLGAFDELEGPEHPELGLVARVKQRWKNAQELEQSSLLTYASSWTKCIARLSDAVANPKYGGLRLSPQMGLVPLGRDPHSNLFEFAHVGSGVVPLRGKDGALSATADTAIVLVLIPPGSFVMGAQRTNPKGPNFDPWAADREGPTQEKRIEAFFFSKYECTKAQWAALSEGLRPSRYPVGARFGGNAITARSPVEGVTWNSAMSWLPRHRLRLPTEAEWEYATRASTTTPWATGSEPVSLAGFANLADSYGKKHGGPAYANYLMEVDDGYVLYAPVGTYKPNAFGLHDTLGNVWELCSSAYRLYGTPVGTTLYGPRGPVGMKIVRGGAWEAPARALRSAVREGTKAHRGTPGVGVRPAASIFGGE